MTDQEPQRKKGGRPRRHAPNAKRPTMAFRMNSSVHERLIKAAEANERSLSEEIERRIERSLANDEDRDTFGVYIDTSADALFAGRRNLDLFVRLSDYIFVAEQPTKKRWNEDAETRKNVLEELLRHLPLVMNQAGQPLLSLTNHLKARERKLDYIRSHVATDDEQENI